MALTLPKPLPPHGLDDDPSPRPASAPELNLLEHVGVLWRHRWVLVLVPLLAAIGGYGVSKRMTRIYVAEAKVWVTMPKFGTDTTAAVLYLGSFKALLENRELAADVIKELQVTNLSPDDFVDGNLTVTNVRDSSIFVVAVRLPDAQLAARAANRLADRAVALALRLERQDSLAATDLIKQQVESARALMEDARTKRDAFRRQAQIELLKQDVETLLAQRGDLQRLNVEIEAERARAARAEEQFRVRDRVDTLRRTVDSDPTLLGSAGALSKDAAAVLSLQLKTEQLNSVYQELDQELSRSRTRLSGLEKQREQLVGTLKLSGSELAQLKQLYERESQLAQLDVEVDLTRSAYIEFSKRLEQARLQVAGRSAQVQVVDRALPPERPIWPRPFRNAVMVAAAACFMMAVGLAAGAHLKR